MSVFPVYYRSRNNRGGKGRQTKETGKWRVRNRSFREEKECVRRTNEGEENGAQKVRGAKEKERKKKKKDGKKKR